MVTAQPTPPNATPEVAPNAETIRKEIVWFAQVVHARLKAYQPAENTSMSTSPPGVLDTDTPWFRKVFQRPHSDPEPEKLLPPAPEMTPQLPDLSKDTSVYANFINYYHFSADERLVLILALLPHVQPHILDAFFSSNKAIGRGFTEFGGVKGLQHGGFIPTIETALFVLSHNDLARRFELYRLFEPDHVFYGHNILQLQNPPDGEPFYSARLGVSDEYVDFLTTGYIRKPQFSMDFPAKRMTTQMEWEDLIMDEKTATQLDEIKIWLQHNQTLLNDWGMSKKLKPGFKALFHGPPGTGKTLTVALFGKLFGLDVYRIDLSLVISKYIGDTEKNLEKVFKKAENKNWILFFDEADALFGKRTNISDAHDKYANQEISYLLQRLEDYPGLVILASNMRNNVDEAFTRRLQAVIHFPKPQPAERLSIWQNAFSEHTQLADDVNLEAIARQHDLAGGSIINVVQFASLMALSRQETIIRANDLLQGIRKEFQKEGKLL